MSCIIIAEGDGSKGSHVEAIIQGLGMIQFPILPKCLQLDHGTWKEHSTLHQFRSLNSVVKTQTGIFVFGGQTYKYLPKGSTTWLIGKTEIPKRFDFGYAIAVKSDQEIWLIGGLFTEKRILSFNVNDHTFKELPNQLNVGRRDHRCAFIPNTKKVMITHCAQLV